MYNKIVGSIRIDEWLLEYTPFSGANIHRGRTIGSATAPCRCGATVLLNIYLDTKQPSDSGFWYEVLRGQYCGQCGLVIEKVHEPGEASKE